MKKDSIYEINKVKNIFKYNFLNSDFWLLLKKL